MSTLRTDTLSNAAGTKSVPVGTVVDGSAKAWVNFNGTGTVAIRASFNVASITDNGTGLYTVNFANAMPDANFSSVFTCGGNAAALLAFESVSASRGASFVQIDCRNSAFVQTDSLSVSASIYR